MEIHFRKDGDVYRVWRNDWGGDMFEVMGQDNFDMVRWVCARFSIKLIDKTNED